jgi:hypothetical protein
VVLPPNSCCATPAAAAPPSAIRCWAPPPQVDATKTSIDGYRALHANFNSDPNMTKAVGKLANSMAADMGMAPKRADPQAALGQEGANSLFHLVATSMRAYLQMNGSGRDHRFTVAGANPGGWADA